MFKEGLNGFHLCLEISCSHPCSKKIRFEGSKAMNSRLFAIILFHHFFQERYNVFQRVFIVVHQISLAKLKQGWDKTA